MRIGVVIERARESKHRPFISEVKLMVKDKQLCSQASTIISKVVNFFVGLKMCSGRHSPLKRMSEATGQ